ncbi:hypothetical protein HYPSUDRAFT_220612 [Hypholoma sublateritium FD-334 SS-4]|uniref:Uncharacterized protein n=1 Tax=Hypholoma sublateritium (strain FD-334 SS-4) TaxID=945553 RepID=A0A0D2NCC1_HYPSF|nr:hypothetical protein HYPSUDRAFT_220612 [Hypholoma sublateritium FD-334 SS-4]
MDTPITKAFVSACQAGDLAEAEAALSSWRSSADGNMHVPSSNADHPLQAGLVAAAEKGHAGIVKFLLESGFRVSPDVVLAASKSQSSAVFQAMIDAGWDINQSAGLTGDALSHAAAADRYALAKWLLEHGADPNCNDRAGMWTTLDLVLLDNGADAHEVPDNDLTTDEEREGGLRRMNWFKAVHMPAPPAEERNDTRTRTVADAPSGMSEGSELDEIGLQEGDIEGRGVAHPNIGGAG